MDFISNLIKRPISLVRSDSLPSTPEPPETTARVERNKTPERQNQLITNALNDSLVAANIMDALNLCDEFRPLATTTSPRATSPLQQSLMQPFTRALQTSSTSSNGSNGSNSGSAITTNNTIEELLIQINDNLNMGDLEDGQRLANISFPLSKPSSAVELNAICSKSTNVKVPTSPLTKESSPSSLKSAAMAPVAEITASAPILNRQHVDTTTATKQKTDDFKVGKIIGLTEFDEVVIPELPTNLNLNATERVKLTFEDGLIPTLTADINEHATNFMKDDTFNKTHNHLTVASEPDTAASSDNETFAECQSYQDGSISIDADYMGFEHAIETSQMDAYFSAANSRNVTVTNFELDPLSLDKTPDQAEISHQNIGILLPKPTEKPNEQERDEVSIIDSFGDEPMDVDMSISEFKQQTESNVQSPCTYNLEVEKTIEEESATVPSPDTSMPSSSVTQHDLEKVPTTLDGQPESTETDIGTEQVKNEISLNTSVESPVQSALNSTINQEHFDSSTTVTASEISSEFTQNINISTNTSNGSVSEHCVESTATKLLTPNKPELTETNISSSTAEMNASTSSSKSSASSASFPIKQNASAMKQFPRSPTKVVEKEMPFLEKSEYTERIEIERKKSTTLPPSNLQKISEFDKTTTSTDALNTTIVLGTATTGKSDNSFEFEDAKNTSDDTNAIISHIIVENTATDSLVDEDKKRYTFDIQTVNNLQHTATDLNTSFNNDAPKIETSEPDTIVSTHEVEVETNSENIDLDDGNKERRRTFVMPAVNEISEINENFEKRRTFNIQAPISANDTETEPMDIDETLQATFKSVTPPSTLTHSNNMTTSPPIPTLQNRAGIQSTYSTSPPIPTLQKDRQIVNEFEMPKSPPIPALHNHQANGDKFKVPPLPTQHSPPITTALTRPPIHATRADIYKNVENTEVLSAKEQTKSVAYDEKDVFVGNGTPSPMEEMSSPKGFGGFGSGINLVTEEQEFANADFQNQHNLILNPSDFDYLLTKGNNSAPVDRSSILLKFDPLLGVPVLANQVQQQSQQTNQVLQQILGGNLSTLSPTIEEDEHSSVSSSSNGNNQSFVIDNKRRSFGLNSTNASAKSRESSVKGSPEAASQSHKQQQQNQAAKTKKHASMSVDVIKDMNVDNDCNKSFENSSLQADEKQMNYKMDELEKKIKNEVLKTEDIEKKLKEAEQREEALIKRITDKDKTITKMTGVIEAYEKAIAELIAEKEQLIQNYEKQLAEVKSDRDSNYQHLTSLETTFSDLHVKYEKSKEMTLQLKSNEESLLSEKRQILENLRLQEQRYDKMKNHAMQQLEIANKKLESLNKEHSIEATKLKALLKKEEISRASINEQLQQKSRENAELVKICDELINGQGS